MIFQKLKKNHYLAQKTNIAINNYINYWIQINLIIAYVKTASIIIQEIIKYVIYIIQD